MLDAQTRTAIVGELLGVYRTRRQIPLLSTRFPHIEIEDAYRIQEEFLGHRVAAGHPIRGYKIGLTSKAMQEMAGACEPDFSAMTDEHFLPGNTPLECKVFFDPLVEIEIAFVMQSSLRGPGVTAADVVRATDFVLPAIEIVDFRVERGPRTNVIDTIADLAACGGTILGTNPRRLGEIDVRNVRGAAIRNGVVEQEGLSSAVLGDPVNAVAWLANKLGEFGIVFEAGQVVLSGSFVRAFPVHAGDEIVCRFDQGLGEVITSFA